MINRELKILRGLGGCGEVLRIALPLILSTSSFTIQMFIDRVFLMWYSSDTMSAAVYWGIVNFTLFSFFLGTATYVNTFVAQYHGSGQRKRIGAAGLAGDVFFDGSRCDNGTVGFFGWAYSEYGGS